MMRILRLVKLQHALFALPLTLASAVIVTNGELQLWDMFWVLVAFMSARSLGMGLNRLLDHKIDRANPRTAHRMLASNQIGQAEVSLWLFLFLIFFIVACMQLHPLTLKLAVIPVLLLFLYPGMKRYSILCHAVLGLTLALGPMGAAVALTGNLPPGILALGAGIAFWVHGFDILYALQDEDFDRSYGLYSVPVRFGSRGARLIAASSHGLVPLLWWVAGLCFEFGWLWHMGLLSITLLLIYEHRLVLTNLEANIGLAFFRLNSGISLGVLAMSLIEVYG